MSDHSTRFLAKSLSSAFSDFMTFSTIFFSVVFGAYSCSSVTGNRSRKASFRMFVAVNFPLSSPLPFVFAVAKTVNPASGFTKVPIFFRKTPLPSSTGCKHIIWCDARSISSSRSTAPRFIAETTGPSCQTVSPLIRRKPPSKSSSSVAAVMFTRNSSRFC